jgi:hypothetical protein
MPSPVSWTTDCFMHMLHARSEVSTNFFPFLNVRVRRCECFLALVLSSTIVPDSVTGVHADPVLGVRAFEKSIPLKFAKGACDSKAHRTGRNLLS